MGAASYDVIGVPGRLVGVLTDLCPGVHLMSPPHLTPSCGLRRSRFSERSKLPVGNHRPLGTNGYTTFWGTNAHGERSACPPGHG